MKDFHPFSTPIRKKLKMIEKNWKSLTAFYFVEGAPATNNLLENYYSTSLKTHRKKQLREKGIKRSPLRDVAGMVRSFHYAVYSSLSSHPVTRSGDFSILEPWSEFWYTIVCGEFLSSYFETMNSSNLIPDEQGRTILLRVFMIEKAVYEVGYEMNNRPEWINIPIKGIKAILGGIE
jgi:Uncharacterized protein, probably involved in trehalose biosynthesis